MAGLAGFIGGVGSAAAEHGKMIRELLERRRHDYAAMIAKEAEQETDPAHRKDLIDLTHKLYTEGDMSGILPKAISVFTKRRESNEALSQAAGGPPAKPVKPLGPGSGLPGMGDAAQPATSPVQKSEQPQQIQPIGMSDEAGFDQSQTSPIAQQIAPPPQASPQQSPISGAPTSFMGHPNDYWQATPAGRAQLERFMQPYSQNAAELQHAQALHEFDLANKRKAYEGIKPLLSSLPPHIQAAYAAEAGGLPAVQLPQTYFTPRTINTLATGESAPPGAVEFGTNNPVDRSGKTKYTVKLQGDGTEIWSPTLAGTAPTTSQTATGGLQRNDRFSGARIGDVEGAVAPSQNTLHMLTAPSGRIQAVTGAQANAGNFINPQFAPVTTSSTHEVPGQLPETTSTTRTRGGPIPAAGQRGAIPPIAPSSGTGGGPVAAMYKDWADGTSTPTGKNKVAVEEYARQNGLQIPTAMSAAGQKDVSHIDEVLGQISSIKQKMKELKLDNSSNRIDSYVDYLRAQRLGDKTKYGGLWTDLSFEGLRSGGAALQGMSARGQQIINRALEHVPRPTAELNPRSHEIIHAPDTPARMYQKLEEMENILKTSKENVLRDEKKSGIIQPVGGQSPSQDGGVVEFVRDKNGKLVRK